MAPANKFYKLLSGAWWWWDVSRALGAMYPWPGLPVLPAQAGLSSAEAPNRPSSASHLELMVSWSRPGANMVGSTVSDSDPGLLVLTLLSYASLLPTAHFASPALSFFAGLQEPLP